MAYIDFTAYFSWSLAGGMAIVLLALFIKSWL